MILNDISIRLTKLTIFRAFRLLKSLASVPIKNDRWLGYSKVWWNPLANKVELKFTSCSGIMKIIKKRDKTLWLTLISSCIAFYYANETSNTVNLIPVKNMNLFSFSKHKDICVRIKYLMEIGDGAHFTIKWNSGVRVTGSKIMSPFAPVSTSGPLCHPHYFLNSICFVI